MGERKTNKRISDALPVETPAKSIAKKSTKITETAIQAPRKVSKSATEKKTVKKTPTEEKRKVGRKPWVPDYGKIENWANNGLSDKAIAALSGISHPVFCTKKNELPKLRESLEYGRARGEAAVSQVLLIMALKGDKDMIRFYLARRCGWSETSILEIPKSIGDLSEEEMLAVIEGRQI